jgi:hypothetical protein
LDVDNLGASKVDYSDSEGNYVGSVPIPQEYIYVDCHVHDGQVDIVFALNSSGSMEDSDPADSRKYETKRFVGEMDYLNEMDPGRHKAGLVSWDDDIDFTCPEMECITCMPWIRCDRKPSYPDKPVCQKPDGDFTLPDDFTYIKNCIDEVDSYGSTNTTLGLHAAIDLMKYGGRDEVSQYIIFFSDGTDTVPPYFGDCENGPPPVVQRAIDLGIAIYAIGLGDDPNEEVLRCMADYTGGKYYPEAADLEQVFHDIFGQGYSESSVAPPLVLSQLKRQLIPKPPVTKLYPNYPNPFNPETWIPYQVAKDADVMVRIFDTRGQLIKTIALGYKEAGFYISRDKAAYWDGRNQFGEQVSSGVYFYNLHTGDFTATRKMIIMK